MTQALSAFGFLLTQGFVVAQARHDPFPLVRYESPAGVFVEIFLIPAEDFTGFRVGLQADPSDALTASEIRQLEDVPRGPRPLFPRDQKDDVLGDLSQLLASHGQLALAGDPQIYEEGRALRRAQTTSSPKLPATDKPSRQRRL